ncbi:hypothetical protein EST38_g10985 [Candolleomyces aberdarensis]|uniref:Uncharacterized protein n=1 Tax=Candolleomyces aberdarensis TaxID=2316362 RepID=A0A4Q2D613_9AGAR|nr:hypothetical protein EST38_g10985 [Candolleomyces aberdarensis]
MDYYGDDPIFDEAAELPSPDPKVELCSGCYRRFANLQRHIQYCDDYLRRLAMEQEYRRQGSRGQLTVQKQARADVAAYFGEGDELDFDRGPFEPLAGVGLRSQPTIDDPPEPGPSQDDLFSLADQQESYLSHEEQNAGASGTEDALVVVTAVPPPLELPFAGIRETTDSETLEEALEPAPEPAPEPARLGRGFRQKKPNTLYKDFLPSAPLSFHSVIGQLPETAITNSPLVHPPSPPIQLSHASDESHLPGIPSTENPPSTPPIPVKETHKNAFGLYKRYQTKEDIPHDPDAYTGLEDLCEEPAEGLVRTLEREDSDSSAGSASKSSIEPEQPDLSPYPNRSCYELGDWYWSDDSGKSKESFNKLVSIVTSDHFSTEDVKAADWEGINRVLGSSEFEKGDSGQQWQGDGTSWNTTPVTIQVPFNRSCKPPPEGPKPYTVEEFRYRPLLPLIVDKIKSTSGQEFFHHIPHELRWQPGPEKADVRVHCEMYQSDAFLHAYEEVQSLPAPDGCDLPRCVVGLMFASDETMLTSFGNAKLWPLYMFFANDSKYRRNKQSLKLGDHLPDDFKDFYMGHSGKDSVSQAVFTHCQRELFHEQWKALLDDEFLDAYEHGVVIECLDGVKRRFYPRILTYSADYPEKFVVVLLYIMVSQADMNMTGQNCRGQYQKSWQNPVYTLCYPISGEQLDALSLVPTNNAFSQRLSPFGFNLFDMLVSDLLHEAELGVWKSLFMHLLRLMESLNRNGSNELDKRYRKVPTFGIDTIRRFRNNVSEMKQLAARDYEDMLQCAIPVFEGLIPHPHNQRILKLIFAFAHWHGLAKLRMHTDVTLHILDDRTTDLGKGFRQFVTHTCEAVETKELAREHAARVRRELKQKKLVIAKGSKRQKVGHMADGGRRAKKFSLNTYKYHALGHVVSNIKRFGTSDNLSTQLPESYHHFPKTHYKRTNKKDVPLTLARIQMRQARLKRLRKQLLPSKAEGTPDSLRASPYFIGKSQHRPLDLTEFLSKNRDDIVTQKFMAKLKLHLLPRIRRTMLKEAQMNPENYQAAIPVLQQLVDQTDEPEEQIVNESDRIFFGSNRIYQHQILQIHYTTYDLRREQDTLNPSTSRRHFMCLNDTDSPSSSNPHRFSYGRILGIFHANVAFYGRGSLDRRFRRFDFLWVRWFTPELGGQEPWSACRLDRVSFPSLNKPDSIHFLDPSDVLRACHIIPRFSTGLVYPSAAKNQSKPDKLSTDKTTSYGQTAPQLPTGEKVSNRKGKTKAPAKRIQFPAEHPSVKAPLSPLARDGEDWKQYYINRFVDRDMIMRYHWGLGVGHRYSHNHAPASNLVDDDTSAVDDHESGDSDLEASEDGDESMGVPAGYDPSDLAQAPLAPDTGLEKELDEAAIYEEADTDEQGPTPKFNDVQAGIIAEEGVDEPNTGYDSDASVYGLHDRHEEIPDRDGRDEDEDDDMYTDLDCDLPEADSESEELD